MMKTKNRPQTQVGALAFLLLLLVAWSIHRDQSPSAVPASLGRQAGYELITRYPHDPKAYTQGLVFWQGNLYESAGLYGESSLRQVELASGRVLRHIPLDEQYFGEGLAAWGQKLYQLTWRENTGLIYSLPGLEAAGSFSYPTEGWGLTSDGTELILSDGSDQLTFLDPLSLVATRSLSVTLDGQPLRNLNELEYIHGNVYANIYLTDMVARIDPHSGAVLSMIDLSGLMPAENAQVPGEVLNGIAYDPQQDRLFVTGKHWAWLYEIRLKEANVQDQAGSTW